MSEGQRSANALVTDHVSLDVDFDPRQPASVGIRVKNLDPDFIVSLSKFTQTGGILASILRVMVGQTEPSIGDDLPSIFGRYEVLEDGFRFIPHFPFERGLTYRASFDAQPLGGRSKPSEVQTLEFSLPGAQKALPAEVERIFPSGDCLPENLLRFYVCFSEPMQRGRARTEISLLGPDGAPAPDVLYHAPVELWDRSMRNLTVLLDPGRLKRGVGPNRELGPPLKVGQEYRLAIGPGMLDLSGQPLRETFYKRFLITDAIREHIAVEQWKIELPTTGTCQPLVLNFSRPLDWALLSQAISVMSENEMPIDGRIVIDQNERRWNLTPTSPWEAGHYSLRVLAGLEDVCGNSVITAFDRSLRSETDPVSETANRLVSFQIT